MLVSIREPASSHSNPQSEVPGTGYSHLQLKPCSPESPTRCPSVWFSLTSSPFASPAHKAQGRIHPHGGDECLVCQERLGFLKKDKSHVCRPGVRPEGPFICPPLPPLRHSHWGCCTQQPMLSQGENPNHFTYDFTNLFKSSSRKDMRNPISQVRKLKPRSKELCAKLRRN